jgi:fatty-acid desaturase
MMAKNNYFNWLQLLEFIAVHVLAVSAIFYFSWTNIMLMLVLLWLTLGWGIGIGYHRLLSHRSFQPPKWFEYCLAILGSMALQKGVISWITNHRIHHAFTETNGDPHTPNDGLFWSHIGWMLKGIGQDHPFEVCLKYSPDLCQDKFYLKFEKVNRLPAIVVALILIWVGGWGWLAWGVGVRIIISWHSAWGVNSLGHKFGPQRFKTNDGSRNNFVLGILTFGDGFHNNHHAFPTSARHGFAWYELDINFIQIKLLEKIGFFKSVKTPSKKNIDLKQLEKSRS